MGKKWKKGKFVGLHNIEDNVFETEKATDNGWVTIENVIKKGYLYQRRKR